MSMPSAVIMQDSLMHWDDSDNAGFTTGTPWISVNENYKKINAAAQVNDPDSVFSYYKKADRAAPSDGDYCVWCIQE